MILHELDNFWVGTSLDAVLVNKDGHTEINGITLKNGLVCSTLHHYQYLLFFLKVLND